MDKVEKLIADLSDSRGQVRRDAAYLLGGEGDPRAIPALIQALTDEDKFVRRNARDSLRQLKAPVDEGFQLGELVGFGTRLGAYLIDGLILLVPQLLFGLAAVGSRDPDTANGIQCLSILVVAAYYIGFWTSRGQTPGKMAMGIKIVKADGSPVTFGTALVRYLGYWISALVLLLGFLWVLWDADRQGWHDKMAGTYVVRV